MPELPEVQTIVDDLNRKVKGDTVTRFWSDWPKALDKSLDKICGSIKNRVIEGVDRHGKFIVFNLSGGKKIVMHLRMTGHLLVKTPKNKETKFQTKQPDYFADKVNQYIHHIFYLKSGRTIEFSDARKFGTIRLIESGMLDHHKSIKRLGIDAAGKEFTCKQLKGLTAGKMMKIKSFLLDQHKIAGIGNIYASEILFASGINPEKPTGRLTGEELKRLHLATRIILKKAIKMRGTSDSDYRDTAGAPGSYQKVLKVYRRTGKKCPRCATIIKRKIIGQRGTFYCPICQK